MVATPICTAWLLLALPSRQALAAPTFRLTASGDCPSRAQLEAALVAKGWQLAAGDSTSAYVIHAQSDGASAVVEMQSAAGEPVLQRRIDSRDCHAIAQATLVVVEAYFVDIGEPFAAPARNTERPELPTMQTPPVQAAEPVVPSKAPPGKAPSITTEAVAAAPPQLDPTNPLPVRRGTKRLPTETAAGPSTAPPKTTEMQGATASDVVARWRSMTGIGVLVSLPSNPVAPRVELGAGVDLPAWSLGTDIAIATSSRTRSTFGKDRVNRWASQGLWRIAWLATQGFVLRPWGAIGLSMVRLNASDLPTSPSRTTYSALVGGGIEATWPIGGNWSSRIDIGCVVLGTRDQYYVANAEIGHGPRVGCHSTFGLALTSDR